MNKNRLIKHKSIIHSKTYTEEELYKDDIDQPEDDTHCNICEKGIFKVSNLMRHNINGDKKNKHNRNHRILQDLSKPLQCEYCHKIFTTNFNFKRHNLTHMYN